MNLREWASNSEDVNKVIDSEDIATGETMNVLGYSWNSKTECVSLKHSRNSSGSDTSTNRICFKELASIFDPFGIFSPIHLRGKILLQTLWKKQLDWDEAVEDKELLTLWESVRCDLKQVTEIKCKGL